MVIISASQSICGALGDEAYACCVPCMGHGQCWENKAPGTADWKEEPGVLQAKHQDMVVSNLALLQGIVIKWVLF